MNGTWSVRPTKSGAVKSAKLKFLVKNIVIWRHRDGHVSALDMAALWQDEQAAFTVDPRNTDDAKGEVLLEFDEHIVAYRKMRRSRLADLEN